MSTARPANRQRSGGGRALMLLGVLLAVLSGILVIYIVSQATSSSAGTVQLVVIKQSIPSGTTLDQTTVAADFGVENYPASLVPAGAYIYSTQDALQAHLNQSVVLVEMVPGDVLLTSDPRIGAPGTRAGSITSLNENILKAGDVLFNFSYASPTGASFSFITAGDTVDILALECSAPFSTNGHCNDQTTLQNIPVYATFSSSIVLVLNHTQAEQLRILAQSGTIDIVIRKPNDTTTIPTTSATIVTPESVAAAFGYP